MIQQYATTITAIFDDGSCTISNCVENITQNTFYTSIQIAIDSSNTSLLHIQELILKTYFQYYDVL